jgi:hypothetical protein
MISVTSKVSIIGASQNRDWVSTIFVSLLFQDDVVAWQK